MSVVPAAHQAMPDDWVPVDRRWLGLDKRTIPPAVISVLLVAIFVVILPAIDRSIAYDRQIRAGDIVDLGSGITFVPAVGWNFPEGLLTSQQTAGADPYVSARLESGGVTFAAVTGPFSGTASELLDRIHSLNTAYNTIGNAKYLSDRVTVITNGGVVGVAQGFVGVNIEGLIAAFVIDGIGIEFVVSGPPGLFNANAEAIDGMISSLQSSAGGGR